MRESTLLSLIPARRPKKRRQCSMHGKEKMMKTLQQWFKEEKSSQIRQVDVES